MVVSIIDIYNEKAKVFSFSFVKKIAENNSQAHYRVSAAFNTMD